MPKLRELARSASDSACNFYVQSQSRITPKVGAFLQKAEGWRDRTAEEINGRLGVSREDWIEITRIALRLLLPFIAVLFSIVVFPEKMIKLILLPTFASVLFLSAFYGIGEEDLNQDHNSVSLSRVPSSGSSALSEKEAES